MDIVKALKHPGNLIILGFITMALAMLTLVYKSTQVKFDLAVEGDYYKEEVAFNDQVVAQQNALAYGKELDFIPTGNKLTLRLPTELSSSLDKGTITFYCLPDSKLDKSIPLASNTDGIYLFDRKAVASGHNYIVKLKFTAKGTPYYKEFKLQ